MFNRQLYQAIDELYIEKVTIKLIIIATIKINKKNFFFFKILINK